MRIFNTIVSVALVMCFVSAPALAQSAKRLSEMGQELKSVPDLPYLPPYSGKTRNLDALDYPHPGNGGRLVSLSFECVEDKQDVLGFYQSAFKQYGWTVNKAMTNDRLVQATRGTTICTVKINTMPVQKVSTKFITAVNV